MRRIYIKAANAALCDSLSQALEELDAQIICCCDDQPPSGAELSAVDAVMISTPLKNEFGLNYVTQARKLTSACMIVLAKTDIADEVQSRIKFTGAYVLPRPFSKAALVQTVKMALLANESMQRLEEEKSQLTKQLDDVKTIDRAKCCLIEYLGMTEAQAHKHIQKLAMDTRRPQREIAEDILRTYLI